MKKRVKAPPSVEENHRDYGDRLAELEAELQSSIRNSSGVPPTLVTVTDIKLARLRGEAVVQFSYKGIVFAAGHTDVTFLGTNNSRGVRTIHLYDDSHALVLGIDGDFENHQFGANFHFRSVKTFVAGPWQSSFMAITTSLRAYRVDYREQLRERRAAALRKNR